MGENILFYLPAVPLGIAVLAFGIRSRRIVELLHLAGITIVAFLSLLLVRSVLRGQTLFALNQMLYADSLTAILVLIIGVLGFLDGFYSIGYLRHDLEHGEADERSVCSYYGFFHIFLFTMLLSAISNNIAIMWAAVEATTLGSAFLVGFYKHKTSAEGAWKYVLICSVGLAFALYGTILTYSDAFTILQDAHRAMLWTEIAGMAHSLDPQVMKLAFVFILLGFGTKAGLFPMHTWLPDAHSEAPSPASAMLSGVLLKCALFAIIRYYAIALQVLGRSFPQTLLLIFGLLSVCVAAFFILVQNDIKRKLAYSSVEHIGIITTGLGVGGALGIFAALLHAINHSITKSLLFCASGNVVIKYGTRDSQKIRGLLKVAPFTGLMFMAGLLTVAGSPPLNIFVSEFMTLTAGLKGGYLWPMILLLIALVIVFAALVILISGSVFGSPPEGLSRGEVGWLTLLPFGILFLLMAGLGIYIPAPLNQLLQSAVNVVLGAR
ncbi:NAD(P)H-quinone oxidoreductase subunit 2 [Moorella thermoacetica]|uniref:Hydrogenase-4 component B n=1 Tax=Neomoorella thermoacetica TaxID=1525 RepID=A0A1D7XE75_NEOTH|nr:hydrogenase 4 subunit F [Moorella thermoacetica]AOQ25171.1 Hydrogenase-4 component B [Moorella thermoacetica]APC09428.1 hydrogenase-4 component B [Moorella thermoacetica]OIQ09157.1 hydrogenase-4 component B [Moorella thermoacetica]OIQ10807.1 hydrogenase-4 component B [Moorella thermoacetica]OIQ53199.1 hydrogenase-4 component B [Moorella thermoacetica]